MKNKTNKQFLAFSLIIILNFVGLTIGQVKNPTKKSVKKSKVPVVLIHGIGGSNLRQPQISQRTKNRGFLGDGGFPNDVRILWSGNPRNLQFTSRGEPRTDTLSKTVIADGFYDVPGKNIIHLSEYFIKQKGYKEGSTLFEFAYDFRYSVNYNADKLGDFIQKIKTAMNVQQVDIVGHSMGGMIAKAYLSDEANAANVRTLVFVGTPHLGAPKALKVLRYGDDLGVKLLDECKVKRASHNYPSMYNLLPGKRYFEVAKSGYFFDDDDLDSDNIRGLLDFEQTLNNLKKGIEKECQLKEIDVMKGDEAMALNTLNNEMVERDTIKFHESLDNWKKPASVTVFNIVGYGVETIESIRESGGKITFNETTEGDGTVPLWSAETVEADAVYYVNLGKFKTEHSEMIGDKNINLQISKLLEKGANIYITETSNTRPTSVRFSKKSRVLKIK